jgi:hypothetical protein
MSENIDYLAVIADEVIAADADLALLLDHLDELSEPAADQDICVWCQDRVVCVLLAPDGTRLWLLPAHRPLGVPTLRRSGGAA